MGSTDAVWPTLTVAQTTAIGASDHRYGSRSGSLVTDLTNFACPEDHAIEVALKHGLGSSK